MLARPITHSPAGEMTGAEGKNGVRQKGKTKADPQTGITAMCRQAESLTKLMEVGADSNDAENTQIRDTAFERVCAIASEMVHYDATAPADILGKIRLWRILTTEDGLDLESGAPDERLLLSIIEDIERHLGTD